MEEELLLWSSPPSSTEIRSNTGGTIESFEQGWTHILAKDAYPAFRRILAATQQVSSFLAEFAHPRANSANTLNNIKIKINHDNNSNNSNNAYYILDDVSYWLQKRRHQRKTRPQPGNYPYPRDRRTGISCLSSPYQRPVH